MKKNVNASDAESLRQKAEEQLKKKEVKTVSKLSESDALKLVHELEVHQIELEMQNEELIAAISVAQDAIKLYDFAPTGYFTISKDGEIVRLNLNGAQLLGKERGYLVNARFGFFVSDDTKPIFNAFLENIFISKVKEQCEVTLSTNDNAPLYVHLSGIAIENEEHSLITMVDITERKRSEQALRLSEERFRAIWDESFDGMRLMDKNGIIVMVNNAFCNLVCKTRNELEDHSLDVMYDPIGGKRILSIIVEKIRSKTVAPHFERQLTLWDDRKVYFELSNSFIKLGTGQNYLLSIFRDITARKHAEIVLQESETHHRELVEGVCKALSIHSPKIGVDITEQLHEAIQKIKK
jgi:PAS domain S-box-containing protein